MCKRTVIVLGPGNRSTLGVVRSLGQKKIPIYAVIIGQKDLLVRYSRFVDRAFYVNNTPRSIVNELLDIALTENARDKRPLIIPTNDFAVKVLDDNLDVLKKWYIYSHIMLQQGLVSKSMNKSQMIDRARAAGLRVPVSQIYNLSNQLDDANLPNIPFPCIVKPCDSVVGGKEFIKMCKDPESLARYIEEIKEITDFDEVVVQEYVHGRNNFMIDLMGIVLKDGNVFLPGFFKKLRQIRSLKRSGLEDGNCSLTALTNSFFGLSPEILTTFIQGLNYEGLFDIEFKVVDGTPIFIEINFRIGGPSYLYTAAGVNLPYIYYRDIDGDDVSDLLVGVSGQSIAIMEDRDFKNVLDGNITLFRWLRDFLTADSRMIFNARDPLPFFAYFIGSVIRLFG